MRGFLFTFCATVLLASAALARSAGPDFVEAAPEFKAREVDPATTEIRLTFDVPISEVGVPFCGEELFLPQLTGKPSYPDEFTVVFPVELEPQQTYRMILHCNEEVFEYRQPGVEPERPVIYYFTTGAAPGDFTPVSAKNLEGWRRFRELFNHRYCYYNRIEIDWVQHFDDSTEWILSSPTPLEFAQRLAIILEPAKDGHISVVNGEPRVGIQTDLTPFEYNGNFEDIEHTFPNLEKHNENLWSARDGDVGYLMVGSMMNTGYQLDPIKEIMPEMRSSTKSLILDLRTNPGGLDSNAKDLASWFFDHPVKFAWMRQRHESNPGGWSGLSDQWLNGRPWDEVYRGKLIVLQGQMSASAAEWFVLMMENHDNVVTVGDRTMGCSASPVTQDLGNGVWMNLPALMAMRLDETDFEGVGIEPDVKVDGDFSERDLVLEKAMELAIEAAAAKVEATPTPRKKGLTSWP